MNRKKKSLKLLEATRTFLEMHSPPRRPVPSSPLLMVEIHQAKQPTVSFYRYLYNTVGEAWNWTSRRLLKDAELRAIIHDRQTEIYVAYVTGVPAGYIELVVRSDGEGEVEIAYIGVIPEFQGRGLGRYLLDWAIAAAWLHKPGRVWLDTCTLDHPRALGMYLDAGFVPYKKQKETVVPMATLSSASSDREIQG